LRPRDAGQTCRGIVLLGTPDLKHARVRQREGLLCCDIGTIVGQRETDTDACCCRCGIDPWCRLSPDLLGPTIFYATCREFVEPGTNARSACWYWHFIYGAGSPDRRQAQSWSGANSHGPAWVQRYVRSTSHSLCSGQPRWQGRTTACCHLAWVRPPTTTDGSRCTAVA
jgi:hypothetical protein